jgi:hypothetical protein
VEVSCHEMAWDICGAALAPLFIGKVGDSGEEARISGKR